MREVKMAGRFLCKDTFAIKPNLFVIAGNVLEGEVSAGMKAAIRFNSSLSMTVSIAYVETICAVDSCGKIGLVIKCSKPGELEILKGLNIHDEELKVFD